MPRIISKNWLRLSCIFLTSFGVSLAGASLVRALFLSNNSQDIYSEQTAVPAETQTPTPITIDFIDLQATAETWVDSIPAPVSLLIYDLSHQQIAASVDSDEIYATTRLQDLLFAYNAYRQISLGNASETDYIGTFYDTTLDSTYAPAATDYTLGVCADTMLHLGHAGCRETLDQDTVFRKQVNTIIDELNLSKTTNAGAYSTADDIELFLEYIQQPTPEYNAEIWAKYRRAANDQTVSEISLFSLDEFSQEYIIILLSDEPSSETSFIQLQAAITEYVHNYPNINS